MNKILFIGSNPSVRAGSSEAFTTDTVSGRILQSWLNGIHGEFHYDNIVSEKTENNRPLKKSEMALAQVSLAERIKRINPDRIVALGKSASTMLGKMKLAFLEMPHPSGLNRKLNDKQFVADSVIALRSFLAD